MEASLQDLEQAVATKRREIDRRRGEARLLAEQGRNLEAEVGKLRQLQDLLDRVTVLLTTIGEERQDAAQRQIEELVTRGLQTIFREDLSFHLVSSTRGKQAVTDFVVRSLVGGEPVDTPIMDARGGGLASVCGFLLRLVVLLLSPQRQAPLLVLDESFAQVSAEYEPRLAEFLRELVDQTAVQIILVTHSDAFSDAADKVYRFQLKDGVTRVLGYT